MHNSSKSKAQFFILSAFAIVSILYLVSRWIEPSTIPDTSSVALMEESFIFNNIKEKAIYAVNGSKSCEDLRYNLQEYELFVEDYVLKKGYGIKFDQRVSPCYDEPPLFPTVIETRIVLKSSNAELVSNFTMEWVPYRYYPS
jgi:hypothetical protein